MESDILRTFPSNECEALALLYIQSKDLSEATPEEMFDKYQDALQRIKAHKKETRKKITTQWTL